MNPGIPAKEATRWMVYRGHSMSHSLPPTSFGCFLLPCKKFLTVGGLMENSIVGKKLKS